MHKHLGLIGKRCLVHQTEMYAVFVFGFAAAVLVKEVELMRNCK